MRDDSHGGRRPHVLCKILYGGHALCHFDLEVVFLYPWAVNFRDYIMMNPESFTAMCIFIGILLVAYLYALGKGALNWHHDPR